MPQVGFELTIPAFEQSKTVRALARVETVIGTFKLCQDQMAESTLILNLCLLKFSSPTKFFAELVVSSDFIYDF
jgi:hypothetical protein